MSLNNTGVAYAEKNHRTKPLELYKKALEIAQKNDKTHLVIQALINICHEGKENRTETDEFVNTSLLTELDQVFVKDGEKCWFVKLGDIRLFESVGNYAKVFFGTNKPLILKSLNALEERLDEKSFFRANRKHIVNLRMIDKIEPYFNGGLLLELKGGEKIEVSRRQTVKFKEMMSL